MLRRASCGARHPLLLTYQGGVGFGSVVVVVVVVMNGRFVMITRLSLSAFTHARMCERAVLLTTALAMSAAALA